MPINLTERRIQVGLFQKVFGNKQQNQTGKPQGFFETFTAYSPTFSKIGDNLYAQSLIRSSINARATHIGKLKIEFSGSAKPKLTTALRKAPNSWQTWGQFLYRLSTILDMQNTAFIVPVYTYNEITGIYPVLTQSCKILQYNSEPYLQYQFCNGKTAVLPLSEVGILNKFQYQDDFFGDNNVEALMPTLNLLEIQNKGIAEAVKNTNSYKFFAQASNFTKAEDLKKERRRFSRENLQGDSGVLLFPNNYQNITQMKTDSYEVNANMVSLLKNDIFNYFGVNEDILQNKAYGDSFSAFYEGAVEPFAVNFSDVLTKMLYTPREMSEGNAVTATSNRLQFMTNADKLNVSSQMADRGLMSRNEIREIWNLSPIPDGDSFTIRGEYYTTEDKNLEGGGEDASEN